MDLVKILRLPINILETIFSYLELVYYEYIIYKNPRPGKRSKGLTIIKLPISYLKERKKKYVGFVGYDD
jgi:hypothetical protein